MALWLILAVLLFGSGAVLGFFSTIFWIIVAIVVIIGLIWFIVFLPKIGKEIIREEIEETKLGFKKHPIYASIFWIIAAVFFIWLMVAWLSQSNSRNEINIQPVIQEGSSNKKLDYQKAREAGYSDKEIEQYLKSKPNVRLYNEPTSP